MQQKEQEGMAGEGDHIYVIDVETRSFSKMLTIPLMICFGMNCRKASWSLLLNLAQMFNKKKKRLQIKIHKSFPLSNLFTLPGGKGEKKYICKQKKQ